MTLMNLNYTHLFSGMLMLFLLSHCNGKSAVPAPDPDQAAGKLDPVEEEALAFPGSEGFGRKATGGRGGKVIFVTKLTDDGSEGTLRYAVEQSGSRYILFSVSGNIELKSRLTIRNGNVTIAGQTAPGDGICIKDYPVVIDADNVIIRFMRFRMGDEAQQQADALEGRFHRNLIIDHCSMSWSTDECVTFYTNENFTLQWCIVSESLRNSVHGKGAHGYGGIWGGKFASFHHNLLAHHDSRNPRLGERADESYALTDLVDLRNNVIYNWGSNSTYGGEAMNVNIVNCYYKPGPATPDSRKERIISIDKSLDENSGVYDTWGKFYIHGNYVAGSARATEDNWTYGVYNHIHNKYGTIPEDEKEAMRMEKPHGEDPGVTTHTPQEAYERVLDHAGASLRRDAVDERVIETVREGTYTAGGSSGSKNGIIDSQEDVGGWPELQAGPAPEDSDGDGMPDAWEREKGLDPESPDAGGKDLSTAYDNIEVYINSLVESITEKQVQ